MLTAKEAQNLMMRGRRVYYKGLEYKQINALIYRKVGNKIVISAELQDKAAHAIVIASLEWIEKNNLRKEERSIQNG